MKELVAPMMLLVALSVHAQQETMVKNEAIDRKFAESWTMEHYQDLPGLYAEG